MSNDKTEIEIKNLREIIKILKGLEGNYISKFYMEAKNVAKPVQAEVIKGIPSSAPIRGMRAKSLRGRTAWGVGKRAKSVTLKANRTVKRGSAFSKGKASSYPIIQVVASSPGTVIADMAGKVGKINRKPVTKAYEINLFGRGVVTRTHRINNQGASLISALSSSPKMQSPSSSRFFWPSALKGMPEAVKKMDGLISGLHAQANRELGS